MVNKAMLRLNHPVMRPLMAAFVGALTTLAFTPYQYWPIAILSPAVLFLLLHSQSSKAALVTGLCWGLGQFATGISWVHISISNFGGMPKLAELTLMGLLISYLALYPALFAGLLNRFFPAGKIRFLIAIPSLWVLSELARGWVFTGFPWLWLDTARLIARWPDSPPVGGVAMISFAVIIIASSLAYLVISRHWLWTLLPVAVLAMAFGTAASTGSRLILKAKPRLL